jgi:rubrerythrin
MALAFESLFFAMFKSIQASNLKCIKNGSNLPARQSLDFALAEFSSAIEMLQAAKLVESKALGKGFVNHALDEYRHTEFFRRLLKSSNNTGLRFDPRLSIALGFINPEKFLFEANDLTRFTAFVAINEASALRMFSKIRPAIDGSTDELKNEIEEIIDDETDHLRSFTQSTTENIKYSDTFVYEMLLLDEERHASLSDGFLEKIASPKRRRWLRVRYKIGNKIRHFWGSQRRVQNVVDKSISILVISLLLPFRGVLNFPPTRKANLICRENGTFLL